MPSYIYIQKKKEITHLLISIYWRNHETTKHICMTSQSDHLYGQVLLSILHGLMHKKYLLYCSTNNKNFEKSNEYNNNNIKD